MTSQTNKTRLTEFDLMMIRAGGRTQADLEASLLRVANIRGRMCAFLANGLFQIALRLEETANRSVRNRHHRFVIQTVN